MAGVAHRSHEPRAGVAHSRCPGIGPERDALAADSPTGLSVLPMTCPRTAWLVRLAFAAMMFVPSWPALSLPAPAAATAADESTIALVLPLESQDYGAAADAVKSGFLAAASAA